MLELMMMKVQNGRKEEKNIKKHAPPPPTCAMLISRWKRERRSATGLPRPKQGSWEGDIMATVATMPSATPRACAAQSDTNAKFSEI